MKELLLKIDDEALEKVTKMLWCRGACGNTTGADINLAYLIVTAIEDDKKTLTVCLKGEIN